MNKDIFASEDEEFFEAQHWQAKLAIDGHERGRGTTWFVRHNDHALVLRHYYRGGFIQRFNRDRYLFTCLERTRSFREYSLLATLHQAGLPVPEPAGARVIRNGRFYQADLITRRIENAHDLLQALQAPASPALIREIAKVIADLHKAGVLHPDLNIQNILVDQTGKVWVIDFDQAKQIKLKNRHRFCMLERLERSFIKEHIRHGILWTEDNWRLLKREYELAYSNQ